MIRFSFSLAPVSLGAPRGERSRSQGQGLLFRGDRPRRNEAEPVRRRGGGAETRRAVKPKQKTAVPPGAARPSGRQRSGARETKGRRYGEPRSKESVAS